MSRIADALGTTPARAYVASVAAGVLALVLGVLAFPRIVYDGFVWHYFWGPVQADANDAVCAVREGGGTVYLDSAAACEAAPEPVAYPGYTLVSEVGYVIVLLVALAGLVLLLRRFDLGARLDFFYALVPFFVFGGALRVLEDADNALGDALLPYPWDTLLISPIIYFTVFGLTLVAIVGAVALERRDVVADHNRALLWAGIGLNVLTVGALFALGIAGIGPMTFYPQVLVASLGLTALATVVTWYATKRYAPWVHHGTGTAGLVVIGAHALDGAANVVGLNWMSALVYGGGFAPQPPGVNGNLVPKHPVNEGIVDLAQSTFPDVVLATLGDAWPFLIVKLVAAVAVLAIFEREMFEESPRYSVLLLVAVTAVGMGPGTRDMLRATFGV